VASIPGEEYLASSDRMAPEITPPIAKPRVTPPTLSAQPASGTFGRFLPSEESIKYSSIDATTTTIKIMRKAIIVAWLRLSSQEDNESAIEP